MLISFTDKEIIPTILTAVRVVCVLAGALTVSVASFCFLAWNDEGRISPRADLPFSSSEESPLLYVGVSSSSSEIMMMDRFKLPSVGTRAGGRKAVPAGAIVFARRPPFARADWGRKGDEAGTSTIESGDAARGAFGFKIGRSTI